MVFIWLDMELPHLELVVTVQVAPELQQVLWPADGSH
jgi:hypothetical protein